MAVRPFASRSIISDAVAAPGKKSTSPSLADLSNSGYTPGETTKSAPASQIADVVAFFLEPDSSFVHGQVLYVDGGSESLLRPEIF